jgi:hypothetical protein
VFVLDLDRIAWVRLFDKVLWLELTTAAIFVQMTSHSSSKLTFHVLCLSNVSSTISRLRNMTYLFFNLVDMILSGFSFAFASDDEKKFLF